MNWNIFGSLSVPLPWRTETTTEKPKTLSYEEFVRLKSKYTGSKTEHATSTSAPTIKKTFTSLSLEEFRLLRSQMREKAAKDKLKERNVLVPISKGSFTSKPVPGPIISQGDYVSQPTPGPVLSSGLLSSEPVPGPIISSGAFTFEPVEGPIVSSGELYIVPTPGPIVSEGQVAVAPKPGGVGSIGSGKLDYSMQQSSNIVPQLRIG